MSEIVLDCTIKGDTTDWAKAKLRLTFESTVAEGEFEAEALGELARVNPYADVKIHEEHEPIENAITLLCKIDGARTDHKAQTVSVVILVDNTEENINKARILGAKSDRKIKCTARFETRQIKMDFSTSEQSVEEDPLMEQAIVLLRNEMKASISMLQRQLRIGYPHAARLMDLLEERGMVGPTEEGGGRVVLLLPAPAEEVPTQDTGPVVE
jgi:DNA segregation ATPase FtsK/SpoIIIE-like protein